MITVLNSKISLIKFTHGQHGQLVLDLFTFVHLKVVQKL